MWNDHPNRANDPVLVTRISENTTRRRALITCTASVGTLRAQSDSVSIPTMTMGYWHLQAPGTDPELPVEPGEPAPPPTDPYEPGPPYYEDPPPPSFTDEPSPVPIDVEF